VKVFKVFPRSAPRKGGVASRSGLELLSEAANLTIRWRIICVLIALCGFRSEAELGVQSWVQRYGALVNADDRAYRAVTDSAGNVFVAGTTDTGLTALDIVIVKYASDGTLLWINQYNGPGNGDDRVNALALDTSGNVFVAGTTLSSNGTYDYVTIKYASGGGPLWTNVYDGSGGGTDIATGAAVDSGGNVYVTGYSLGVGVSYDYVTIKYSGAGAQLWINAYNGPANGDDEAVAVAVDSSDSVYVTGYTTVAGNTVDYATVKYLSGGTAVWTNRFNGLGNANDTPSGLATDSSNNVYVTGYSMGSGSSLDYATVKYSSSGIAAWTNRFNGQGNGDDKAVGVAVDASNNVYVTGSSTSAGNGLDYATIKYSSGGTASWTNRYSGPVNGDDIPIGLTVDRNGNVYVAGYSAGSSSGLDYATIKYSTAGVALWTNRYNGPTSGTDQASALAVDTNNNVFVAGFSAGVASGFDFATVKYLTGGAGAWTNRYNWLANGNDAGYAIALDRSNNVCVAGYSANSLSGPDAVTIKYSPFGQPLWTNLYGGPGNSTDKARALGCDAGNNVYVTGYSMGAGTGYDIFTIKYSNSGAAIWTNVFNGPANLDDYGDALVVDSGNNVIVTGTTAGDYVTLKYSSSGALVWSRFFDGIGADYDEALAVAVDGGNNVIVTGFSTTAAGDYDYATIKYNSAGTALWTNRYNGPGTADDKAVAVATDASSNVYVTGFSRTLAGDYDWTTIKYSSAGAGLWTNRFNGPGNGNDYANALVVDSGGSVYVTGGGSAVGGGLDFVTIKYSSAGARLWTNMFGRLPGGADEAVAMAVDSSSNIFVTGYSAGPNGDDYATIKYTTAGVALWTNFYNGPANGNDDPGGPAIAAGTDGAVYVTGQSDGNFGTNVVWDFATVKYASGVQPGMSSVSRLPSGSIQFNVSSSPNQIMRVDGATNLISPITWTSVGLVTNLTGTVSFVDLGATNFSSRFYRTVWLP